MTTLEKQALFTEQYQSLFDYIYRYVRYRIDDPHTAADIVSTIMLQGFEKIHTFDPDRGNLRQWLTGVMRNQLKNHWRSAKLVLSLDDFSDSLLGALDVVSAMTAVEQDRIDQQQLVTAMLDSLPPPTRRLLILHYVDGLTYSEIATVINKTPASVRKTFSRLHARLADQFATYSSSPSSL